MSRSDFWSIAVTLIVTGGTYFVGGQKAAYGCVAVGALTVLVLLLTIPKPAEPVSTKATADSHVTVSHESNPRMTANPSQKQSVHFEPHIHIPGSQKPDSSPAPPPAPKSKPQHNLQLQSYRMARIQETLASEGGLIGFHFPDDQSKPNAAVACIKNKSRAGEVAHVYDVRAALVFRDDHGREIGNGISHACWVDNHLGDADFDLEESYCVILCVFEQNERGEVTRLVTPHTRDESTGFGFVPVVDGYDLSEDPHTVELLLVSRNSRLLEPLVFEFYSENGEPGIRRVTQPPPVG